MFFIIIQILLFIQVFVISISFLEMWLGFSFSFWNKKVIWISCIFKINWALIIGHVLTISSVVFYLPRSFDLLSDSLTSVTAVNLLTHQEIPVVVSAKPNFENYLDTKIGMWQLICKWSSIVFSCCVGALGTVSLWTWQLSSGLWNSVLH